MGKRILIMLSLVSGMFFSIDALANCPDLPQTKENSFKYQNEACVIIVDGLDWTIMGPAYWRNNIKSGKDCYNYYVVNNQFKLDEATAGSPGLNKDSISCNYTSLNHDYTELSNPHRDSFVPQNKNEWIKRWPDVDYYYCTVNDNSDNCAFKLDGLCSLK